MVSHDRTFLDAVVTDIIHMHSQRLESYRGNYEVYNIFLYLRVYALFSFVCLFVCHGANYVDGAILNLMVILSPPLSLSSTHSVLR